MNPIHGNFLCRSVIIRTTSASTSDLHMNRCLLCKQLSECEQIAFHLHTLKNTEKTKFFSICLLALITICTSPVSFLWGKVFVHVHTTLSRIVTCACMYVCECMRVCTRGSRWTHVLCIHHLTESVCYPLVLPFPCSSPDKRTHPWYKVGVTTPIEHFRRGSFFIPAPISLSDVLYSWGSCAKGFNMGCQSWVS